ncbi:exostosin family protein [Nitzschia inconspicua]|uniref:Exostosin family protein n=1 Tax=Nitzschia inconspicua TaxID=303405 RepID=A0A9K3LM65_9STRA|nr:exostosin family protein [Nitzschia inconspicua]
MAVTLLSKTNRPTKYNNHGSIPERPAILLKVVSLMIVVVLIFQLKLLNKVNDITSTIGFISEEKTTQADLPPQPTTETKDTNKERYKDCIFRDSSLVESVYIYPVPGTPEFTGDILSVYGQTHSIPEYPWVAVDAEAKREGWGPYDTASQLVQYNTELMVRDILTHPDSCLRTNDPEKATLFYVPYLPAAEFHQGKLHLGNYSTTEYGKAIMDILERNDHSGWERSFGLTSKYWKRRGGSDHILVFSEPMHGLWHPRNKRGNYHFIRSQYQLTPPIVISVELSTTFVDMYPNCARKNILMPYPNTDGRWFNGKLNQEADAQLKDFGIQELSDSPAALPSELQLHGQKEQGQATDWSVTTPPRILAQFYKAGNHGTCRYLRTNMANDFKCTPSGKFSHEHNIKNYAYGYRQSTFCPCPGGDSPSAKRMFDALLAGCIPIVLSHDFVWPFTAEFDRSAPVISNETIAILSRAAKGIDGATLFGENPHSSPSSKIAILHPNDYSVRLEVRDHNEAKLDPETCQVVQDGKGADQTPLQTILESFSAEEIARLKQGASLAGYAYSYYRMRPDLPDNPMRESVLPDGGAAQMLVRALEERAEGKLWPQCQRELKGKNPANDDKVLTFVC